MKSKLCLGTAQFGKNYGITNKSVHIDNKEINKILEKAIQSNINYFDTASVYGDAEYIIGKKLKNNNIKISSKFKSHFTKSFTEDDINILDHNFKESLLRLNKKSLDYYLLHNPKDLKKGNNFLLMNWLKDLKEKGLIKRFGLSIYDETDLQDISLKEIQVIQLPMSIYDQRLLNKNFINKLLDSEISIHIRSIFLQGLLLQESNKWPSSINKSFLKHHKYYEKIVNTNNLSLLESSIAFIKKLNFAELILFGVTNISELNSILSIWNSKKVYKNSLDYNLFKWNIVNDIDPRKWNK